MTKPLILIPYCLRDKRRIETLAKKYSSDLEVIKRDEDIPEIVRKYKPSFVIGVACAPKIAEVGNYMDNINQPYRAIPLSGGCIKQTKRRTDVDIGKFEKILQEVTHKERRSSASRAMVLFASLLFILYYLYSGFVITGNVISEMTFVKKISLFAGLLALVLFFIFVNIKKRFYILK